MNKSLSILSIPPSYALSVVSFPGWKALTYLIPYTRVVPYQVLITFWPSPFSVLSHSFWNGGTRSSRHKIYFGFMGHSNILGFSSLHSFLNNSKFQFAFLMCWLTFHWTDTSVQLYFIPKISYPSSNNELKPQHFTCKIITFPPIYITSLIFICYFKETLELALDFTAMSNLDLPANC